jgi:glutathione S-transferase
MALTLYYHPYSRAASVLWMLEELGLEQEGLEADVRFVDFAKQAQKEPEFLALNPMGKLPVLVDDGTVVTEVAAIGLYLADRYSLGKLAPLPSDRARGPYLRWSFFSPSVVEPCLAAKAFGFEFRASSVGWGDYEAMVSALDFALTPGPYLLGEQFSMADVIVGSTLRYMVRFKMLEPTKRVSEYLELLGGRPAIQRADARNAATIVERGLGG